MDALIITGANVANPSLDQESFWRPLTEVIEWAQVNVTSTLCSCLSTHALMKYFYQIDRVKRDTKSGVYLSTASRSRIIRFCARSTRASMCRIRVGIQSQKPRLKRRA